MTYHRTDEQGVIPNAKSDLGIQPGQVVTLQVQVNYPGSGTSDVFVPKERRTEGVSTEVLQIDNRFLVGALIDLEALLAEAREQGRLEAFEMVKARVRSARENCLKSEADFRRQQNELKFGDGFRVETEIADIAERARLAVRREAMETSADELDKIVFAVQTIADSPTHRQRWSYPNRVAAEAEERLAEIEQEGNTVV